MELGGWRKGQWGQCPPMPMMVTPAQYGRDLPRPGEGLEPEGQSADIPKQGRTVAPLLGPTATPQRKPWGAPSWETRSPRLTAQQPTVPAGPAMGFGQPRSSGTCSGSPTGVWGQCRHPEHPASLTFRAPGMDTAPAGPNPCHMLAPPSWHLCFLLGRDPCFSPPVSPTARLC